MASQTNFFANEADVSGIAEKLWEKLYPLMLVSGCSANPSPEFLSVDNSNQLAKEMIANEWFLVREADLGLVRMRERVSRGYPLDRYSAEMIESSPAGMIDAATARCGRLYLYGASHSPFGKAFAAISRFIRRESVPYSDDTRFRICTGVANQADFLIFPASTTRKPFRRQ